MIRNPGRRREHLLSTDARHETDRLRLAHDRSRPSILHANQYSSQNPEGKNCHRFRVTSGHDRVGASKSRREAATVRPQSTCHRLVALQLYRLGGELAQPTTAPIVKCAPAALASA